MASANPSGCPPLTEDDTAPLSILAFPPIPELTVAPSMPFYECSIVSNIAPPIDNVQCFLSTKDVQDNAD